MTVTKELGVPNFVKTKITNLRKDRKLRESKNLNLGSTFKIL